MKIVIVLLALIFQVWCSPSGCEQTEIDNDFLIGTCCLALKEGVIGHPKNLAQPLMEQILSQKIAPKMIYPDEEIIPRKSNENKVNKLRNEVPASESVARKSLQTEDTEKISIGTRVNVDVPDTCTKGYKKDANGKCVKIFD